MEVQNPALQLLLDRCSADTKRLTEPAPTDEELDQVFATVTRAPDHKLLRPYRFITIRGDAREALGDVYADAISEWEDNVTDEMRAKARLKPLRAPLLIAGIADITPDLFKVPPVEQILTTGTAMHSMLLGFQALGYGAVWLSGPFAFSQAMRKALELTEEQKMLGFLYVGTPLEGCMPEKRRPDWRPYFSDWKGSAHNP